MTGAKLVEEKSGYLRFEFRSRLLRFVDDVEFEWDEGEAAIHCRSASRLGYSDLGVNRKRLEAVRSRWQQLLQAERRCGQ